MELGGLIIVMLLIIIILLVLQDIPVQVVHTSGTRVVEQQIQADAGPCNQYGGHQRDPPLKRYAVHGSFSSNSYPSPMRFRMGSYPSAVRSFFLSAEICTRIELLNASTLLSQTCSISSS